MRKIPACHDVLSAGEPTLVLPGAADLIGVTVTRIHALLQKGRLITVHRDGITQIPARFFEDNEVTRFIPDALALPADGGYTREKTLERLFTGDESLPGRPADTLYSYLTHEVVRHARAMAL